MKKPLSERIRNSSTVNPITGCWEWNLRCDRYGYGRIAVDSLPQKAHRISYSAFIGPIPSGMTIDHLCRNHKCVNPAHLEAVTRRENTLRGESIVAQCARKTHCVAGHPLSGQNLYSYRGARICKACNRKAGKAYRAKKEAA